MFMIVFLNFKCMTDDDIKTICIFGLSNFFVSNLKKPCYRLINTLNVLYIINNEIVHFNINWKKKIITILSISNGGVYVLEYFKEICEDLFIKQDSF